jgi:hypothetical protein
MESKYDVAQFEERFSAMRASLNSSESFGSFRILHGYWDKLTKIRMSGFWPLQDNNRERADLLIATEGLISSGFAEELNCELQNMNDPEGFVLSISTIAQPREAFATLKSNESLETLKMITTRALDSVGATLPKFLVETNQIQILFNQIKDWDVLIVGPAFLTTCGITVGKNHKFLDIPEWEASLKYKKIIFDVNQILIEHPNIKCVLFSAGTIPALVGFKLFELFPGVKWIDLGLALSVFNPDGISDLPWFQNNYVSIMSTYSDLNKVEVLDGEKVGLDLESQGVLFRDISANLNSKVKKSINELIINYFDARLHLTIFPKMRIKLLKTIFELSNQDNGQFIHDALDWEIDNLAEGTYSSKLLLAEMLKSMDTKGQVLLSICDDLSNTAPNDYRSRVLKVQYYLNAGKLSLAREIFQQELKDSFSQFRQVKRVEKLLS